MLTKCKSALGLLAVLALALGAPSASAQLASGSKQIDEPNGAYSATKTFAVYADDDPANPAPLAGNLTYVYTITNLPTSFICIIGLDMEVPSGSVTAAGFIPGPGIDPSATIVAPTVVEWDWLAPFICPGEMSDAVFVQSPFGAGGVADNLVSLDGEFALDAPGTCVGPFVSPAGEAMPCTIGFWKNRADEKPGTLQHFADPLFDQIVTAAVALSMGLFADEAALLEALGSQGQRTIQERGLQQLAALFLNLAAGDLAPENQKCKLFEGNSITSNACGTDISVGDAVNQAKVDILGDNAAQHHAQECADDINNGIGVVD